ncbi:unnamed protein product [Pleuronectes platessa]|uniref:Uncharacterized protein n=1 Tax=Pleuronectes platessa TaxID=8262 RepID=A0A9N7Y119_PLEPL|nr:unnamed protein product [Pleuronectes platessa]
MTVNVQNRTGAAGDEKWINNLERKREASAVEGMSAICGRGTDGLSRHEDAARGVGRTDRVAGRAPVNVTNLRSVTFSRANCKAVDELVLRRRLKLGSSFLFVLESSSSSREP